MPLNVQLDFGRNIEGKNYISQAVKNSHCPILCKGDLVTEDEFPLFHIKPTGVSIGDGFVVQNTTYEALLYPKEDNYFICLMVNDNAKISSKFL